MPPSVCPRCFAAVPPADSDKDVRLCPACDRFFFPAPPEVRRQLTTLVLCPATVLAALLTASAFLRP
jgi:hypothetical protein